MTIYMTAQWKCRPGSRFHRVTGGCREEVARFIEEDNGADWVGDRWVVYTEFKTLPSICVSKRTDVNVLVFRGTHFYRKEFALSGCRVAPGALYSADFDEQTDFFNRFLPCGGVCGAVYSQWLFRRGTNHAHHSRLKPEHTPTRGDKNGATNRTAPHTSSTVSYGHRNGCSLAHC